MSVDRNINVNGNEKPTIFNVSVGRAISTYTGLITAIFVMLISPWALGSQENLDVLSFLIDHAQSRKAAASLESGVLAAAEESFSKRSTLWPVKRFFIAEIQRLRGENLSAIKGYRELSEWGAADPYGDRSGGSGLCVVALWRWLRTVDKIAAPEPVDVKHVIAIAKKVLDSHLPQGMIGSAGSPLLEAMPTLRESIIRTLASIAWKADLRKDALGLFFNYMAVTTSWDFTEQENLLRAELIEDGIVTQDRLTLFLGKRLMALKRYDDAEKHLKTAYQSDNYHVKAEAGLSLAQLKYNLRKPVRTIIAILEKVITISEDRDTALIPEALKMRALANNRLGGDRNIAKYRQDLTRLVNDYPQSPLVNEALYLLAKSYQDENDLDKALAYYLKLQDHRGPSDFRKDTCYYQPGLILYARGTPEDIDDAVAVLEKLERERPGGDLHIRALFWLGRFHEERGRQALAKKYFKRVLTESPYSYFGLRSRMHIELGQEAKKRLFPSDEIMKALQSEYRESLASKKAETPGLDGISPYHLRTMHAIEGKLYQKSLDTLAAVRKAFPGKRVEDISIDRLDEAGFLTMLSLLFSLRQDVLKAIYVEPTMGKMKISYMVSRLTHDMPVSLDFLKNAAYLYSPEKSKVQNNIRFLMTAYPPVYPEPILRYAKEYSVKPSLLYAVMRQESLFYPAALSSREAFGLFQFIPSTFRALDAKWRLLEKSGTGSMEEFLIDPDNSIRLGARAFRKALNERRTGGDVFLAIIDHIAGARAVKEARRIWQKQGMRFKDDLEFKIETAPYIAVQAYSRKVITDMTIVEASGMYR